MTDGEKTVVDLAAAASDGSTSKATPVLGNIYQDVSELPAIPREDGLLVMLGDTGSGSPGLALSGQGVWKISTFV